MKKIKLPYSLCLFFILSCSQGPVQNSLNGSIGIVGVRTDDKERIKIPDIKDKEIFKSGGFGPSPIQQKVVQRAVSKKNPVVALILGPGINRSIAHISFLKAVNEKNIPIHVISGSGVSAIVAALYASGMTPSKMEWVFYKLFNQVRDIKPYSYKWLNVIKIFLRKEFGSMMLQDLKLSFVLPIYNKKREKVLYLKRGYLANSLYLNLLLCNSSKFEQSSSFVKEVYNGLFFSKYGADIIIGVGVLDSTIALKFGNDHLTGVFGSVIGRSVFEIKSLDLFFELPTREMFLDTLDNMPAVLQKSLESGREFSEEIQGEIQTWQKTGKSKRDRIYELNKMEERDKAPATED